MKILAQHGGRCGRCGGEVKPGEMVEWFPKSKVKIVHVKCLKPSSADRRAGEKGEAA